MNLKRNTILSAAFDQSPIRSIGPNASEMNVKTLADKQIERLLIAITSLCTALAEQFFPEETVNFQHNDFVTATDHDIQHTIRVYFHEEASRALIQVTADAIALFLKTVIHGAMDLFNKDDNAELTKSQERLIDEFSEEFIATNSGQSLKNPFIILLYNGSCEIEVAVQGYFETAPEMETRIREYHGMAKLDSVAFSRLEIALSLIDDDFDSEKIFKARASNIQELLTALSLMQTDSRRADVSLHQVQDGQRRKFWCLDAISPVNKQARPGLELLQAGSYP